ncbi:hypothetical protein B0H19DRAFT_1254704 [Mycena capillaripes]|nr:hypothetical protein B0H19DRAFT_1254704 [Mycena capillaripes]
MSSSNSTSLPLSSLSSSVSTISSSALDSVSTPTPESLLFGLALSRCFLLHDLLRVFLAALLDRLLRSELFLKSGIFDFDFEHSTTSTTTPISISSTTTTTASSSTSSSNVNPSSLPPSSTASQSNPPAIQSDAPETLPTTVFVTTTDSLGHTTITAPSAITSTVTFTSNGVPVTTTEIKFNPTLVPDGHSSGGSSFFKNTGAVAGVFVLVGLAAAAIVLWVLFGLRRRRRNRRIEHDTAVSATLAAAGFNRAPLDDDELQGNDSRHSRAFASQDMEMRASSALALGTGSLPSGARTSGYQDSSGPDESFNPYNEYDVAAPREGYIPARTSSPPPTAFLEPYRDKTENGPGHSIHHSASQSGGSTEPLLAAFNRTDPVSPTPSGARLEPPTPPPRNPKRVSDRPPSPPPENRHSSASSVYSDDNSSDERLNPDLRNSRVLGVRNGIPDGVSQISGES